MTEIISEEARTTTIVDSEAEVVVVAVAEEDTVVVATMTIVEEVGEAGEGVIGKKKENDPQGDTRTSMEGGGAAVEATVLIDSIAATAADMAETVMVLRPVLVVHMVVHLIWLR